MLCGDLRARCVPIAKEAELVLLDIDRISKTYPGAERPVLSGVSLQLARGETLALTGESGSGKSTLLHLAATLDSFDSGEIRLEGTAYSALDDAGRATLRRDSVALVFQQFNLIPSLSVAQNIAFHARLAGKADAGWIAELTERLGLGEVAGRFPEQLSGGQQQRVAIARALALRPPLLLADEPTGNLDEATSDAVMALMLDLVRDTGAALFLVTHSERIAARLDRRVHLSGGRLA
jgi:putative ABC transport system ATP-binding protein